MEFDVVAESTDKAALLIGECKWTNPEIASELYRNLKEKAERLPITKGKEIIPVLFLKNKPKDLSTDITIMHPEDVIKSLYAD